MSRHDDERDLFGFKRVGDLVTKVAPKRLSRIQQRLIETSSEISLSPADQITYQHTVLCQTGLPPTEVRATMCGFGSAPTVAPICASIG